MFLILFIVVNIKDAIEKNGLYRVKQLIEKFGGWPVLESNDGGRWDERRFNLEDLLVETERHGQNMPLIRVGVTKDLKSASNNIIYVRINNNVLL